MEIYARDWIKDKKNVTELQTLIAHSLTPPPSLPLTPPTMLVLYSVFICAV